MPKSAANAAWTGDLQSGSGTMNFSGFSGPYSFPSRFENGPDAELTNPEQLLAAAHSGCFSMALAAALGRGGFTPNSVETEATVTLEKTDAGFTVTSIHLDCRASVEGIDDAQFQEIASNSKQNCPISRALGAVESVTLDAKLV